MTTPAPLDYLPKKSDVDYRSQINTGIQQITEAYDKKTTALQNETIAAINKWEEAKNQLNEEQQKERKIQNEMSEVTQQTNAIMQETASLKEKQQKIRQQLSQLEAIQDAVRQCFTDKNLEASPPPNQPSVLTTGSVLQNNEVDMKPFFRNARKKLPPEQFRKLTSEIDQYNRGIISFAALVSNGQSLLSPLDPNLANEFVQLIKWCTELQASRNVSTQK